MTLPLDVTALLARLPFVREFGISVLEASPGFVTVTMPFAERFATPPSLFPASIVGAVGDVAAIASCFSLLRPGQACATLDFTVKMTGLAQGQALIAEGRVLQSGQTTSVGAADVFAISTGEKRMCGTVLATGRVFTLKGP